MSAVNGDARVENAQSGNFREEEIVSETHGAVKESGSGERAGAKPSPDPSSPSNVIESKSQERDSASASHENGSSLKVQELSDRLEQEEDEAVRFEVGGCLMTKAEVIHHVTDLSSRSRRFRTGLTIILRKLYEHRMNKGLFNVPVDPVALGLPTYFDVVKKPMDLGTVKSNLEKNKYANPEDFANDVRLVYNNALLFNPPQTVVYVAAKSALKLFNTEYTKFSRDYATLLKTRETHSCARCMGELCELCGEKCSQFQEAVLYCSAPCKARIHRNATYYRLGGDRGQHWCNKCYTALSDNFLGILGQPVKKSDLEKRIHDEQYFEPWVCCSRCDRRVHQICAVYHSSLPIKESAVVCPICVVEENDIAVPLPYAKSRKGQKNEARTSEGEDEMPNSPPSSTDTLDPSCQTEQNPLKDGPVSAHTLPRTAMGDYLEAKVKEVVKNKASPDIADSFTLRVVSSKDCVTKYESRIMRWITAQRRSCGSTYESEPLSSSFPCRSKTILLFQRIDGIDLILFVLYVQEYGNDCPAPNRNKVYISYLDSIAFMEPLYLRTALYQEIMVSYLTWVTMRGFEHAYIWACPPQRGDAYIMYCHPKWQRTPGAEKLRKWYASIVETCKANGIVTSDSNLYDTHLSVFRPLLNTRASRSGVYNKSKAQRKSLAQVSPQTTTSLLHENDQNPASTAFASAPGSQPVEEKKPRIEHPFENLPYFYGDYLPNETEALLTIMLNPNIGHAACDQPIRLWWNTVWGSETQAELVASDSSQHEAPPAAPTNHLSSSAPLDASSTELRLAPPPTTPTQTQTQIDRAQSPGLAKVSTPTWRLRPTANLDTCDLNSGFATPQQRNDWLMRRLAAAIKPMAENFIVLKLNTRPPGSTSQLGDTVLSRDAADPDPALPAGVFDTRLELLDLCKLNHFQFDELRRAKHSSLVILNHHIAALNKARRK